jgi:predicted glycosyltransferase involved in capsule biosynthesis
MNKKLGVIVPYRDRYEQLIEFKKVIIEYLNSKGIDFELIVIEQDDAKMFNRGKLLNIGFIYAKKLKCNYVVFHDVDMLPLDVDYSYSDIPLHLATNFTTLSSKQKRIVFDEYFGGVTLFPSKVFEQIDGYSNKYWGWGYEDDDLLFRCKEKFVQLDEIKIKNINKDKKA